ncbi:radical SAM family heme chaperone HemW [Sulfurimonas sp. C5]|uniref:radical SAM family heme chaperone HemW n=1 Tax=Sulfurimonas sp. C5 TaxID=3036947 RepID=UPI002458AF3D|nr:radical SAM family heme chaperone HemW [Sulfurimonas sp. C5]MDH4945191.1 radical SAM family heme chaperone HemW [Sulfurimonas sp. C5]
MLLYIHIPFCDSKCSYCAFNSYVDKFHLKQEYMGALKEQLLFEIKRFQPEKQTIKTVFIGGGTPSTVAPELYAEIFSIIKPYLLNNVEITTEANPNSATLEWLEGMKNLGVNRISFGVQSFDPDKLRLLNRAHNPKQAIEAIHNAQKVGIENISLDLIYATLGDTKELLQNDLETAFSLPINHLSAYALTIEEGTAFESKPQMSKEHLEHTQWLFKQIEEHGFKQYEISNFGTYNSLHNLGYWEYDEYMGVGAGAVGKYKNTRLYPQTEIEKYIQNPLDIRSEKLSDEDVKIEKIFLGLRSIVGVDQELLNGEEIMKADLLVEEHKLELKNKKYFNKEYLLSDEIALYLTS